jgi:hypothetical protein
MSKLRCLRVSFLENPASPEPRVELRVDGAPLLDLVRGAEQPFATAEGVPSLAGNYAWPPLTPRLVRLLNGERAGPQRVEGVLLNCECDGASCWPFSVRVRVIDRFVIWQDLRQLKRLSRWGYDELEPLRFDRTAYLGEVAKMRGMLLRLSKSIETRRTVRRASEKIDEPCAL